MAQSIIQPAKIDEKYMRRCIQLAQNGISGASPNPMVGAVIVHNNRIIGEGYHCKCGGPHAEVNAIRSVKHPELLPESTIYVSLEPCAHYGKTPPCADLIIEKRIPRVVIGCRDLFAKVNGLGIKKLQDAGCEVVVGVLEDECKALNSHFFCYHANKRPYIILKWAQSRDGFIAGEGRVTFSTPITRSLVHQIRAHSDAILIGGKTSITDNPSLTTRHWPGPNPLRIIIDTHGDLPQNLAIFNDEAETLLWSNWNLEELMADLHERKVQTLLVEGGSETHRHFIEAGLWDEIRVETSPITLHSGVAAPLVPHSLLVSTHSHQGNEIRVFRHS